MTQQQNRDNWHDMSDRAERADDDPRGRFDDPVA